MQMAYNPVDQIRPANHRRLTGWSVPSGGHHDEGSVDRYVRPQIIRLNGIEVVSIIGSRQSPRRTDDRVGTAIAE